MPLEVTRDYDVWFFTNWQFPQWIFLNKKKNFFKSLFRKTKKLINSKTFFQKKTAAVNVLQT